jgi:hypothetical protein
MAGTEGPTSQSAAQPTQDAERIVARVTATIVDVPLPDILVQSLTSHVDNLIRLATSLITAGLDQTTIEAAIDGAFRSYRTELTRAITALGEQAR